MCLPMLGFVQLGSGKVAPRITEILSRHMLKYDLPKDVVNDQDH